MTPDQRAKREAKKERRAQERLERPAFVASRPEHAERAPAQGSGSTSSQPPGSKELSVLDRIQKQNGGHWVGAQRQTEPWAKPRFCYWNVWQMIEREGGEAVFGWYINERTSEHGRYVVLINHAVRAANKRLFDITPFHEEPAHHPVVDGRGSVIFLVDDNAAPIAVGDIAVPQPSRFFAVDESEELDRYLAAKAEQERSELATLVDEVRRASAGGHALPEGAVELSKLMAAR